jgi:hypothetical protein
MYAAIRTSRRPVVSGYRKGAGIMAPYVRFYFATSFASQCAGDREGICATRIILKKTGRNTKLAVW